MRRSRLDLLAPLTGVVAMIMMMIGLAMASTYEPPYPPLAEQITGHFSDNAGRVSLGSTIGALSAFFLILFASVVHSELRKREESSGTWSTAAFGGGVAAAATVVISFTAVVAATQRTGAAGGIDAVGAITLYDLYSQLITLAFPIALAVFIGATAVVSLRTAVFPAWFGWSSALVALGLLTPLAYFAGFFAIVWILMVSIWLYARGRSPEEETAAGDDSTSRTA